MELILRDLVLIILFTVSTSETVSKDCQVKVKAFLECAIENNVVPKKTENDGQLTLELQQNMALCFVRNNCSDPSCLRKEAGKVMPRQIQKCTGLKISDLAESISLEKLGQRFYKYAAPEKEESAIQALCGGSEEKSERVKTCVSKVEKRVSTGSEEGNLNIVGLMNCAITSGVYRCQANIEQGLCKCASNRKLRQRVKSKLINRCDLSAGIDEKFEKMAEEHCKTVSP